MKIRLVDRGAFSKAPYRYVVQKWGLFFVEDVYETGILPDALKHYEAYSLPQVLKERKL